MIAKVDSPVTVIALICILICSLKLSINTNKHHAAVGRKELLLFFQFYVFSVFFDIILICGLPLEENLFIFLNVIQLSTSNSALFSLFISGITSVTLKNTGFFKSISIVRVASVFHFFVSCIIISIGLITKSGYLLFIFLIVVNFFTIIAYVGSQILLLTLSNSEVWAYGTLSIAISFLLIASSILFYGAEFVAFLSDRYLDGLFVFHLFMFCSIIMVHKYWLSICDFEVECASIFMDGESTQ